MDRQSLYRTFIALASTLLVCASAMGQNPGDKVEYKAQRWPEKWEVGTSIKELPGGKQVLVREKPSQFFPEGFERAYSKDEIRPPQNAAVQPAQTIQTVAAANAVGRGLMSEADVLGFLQQRLGAGDPFMNPKREQVLDDLRQEILARGVSFRYNPINDFGNKLIKYGALSNVTAPLNENFGPLGKEAELMGTWRIAKVGAPGNPRFGDAGSIRIDAGGTYAWNTPSGPVRGRWRKATPDEMAKSDKGGEGIVLLNAKSGDDWLVFKRSEPGPEGQGIKITDLATRNLRERAVR